MRMLKKILIFLSGTLLLLSVITLIALRLLDAFATDITFDDSDLRLSRVTVADEDNAYFDLVKAGKAMPELTEREKEIFSRHVNDKEWDDKFVKDLLEKSREALEHFDGAAGKPKYQDPAFADPSTVSYTTQIPSVVHLKRLAGAASIGAEDMRRSGRIGDAVAAAVRIIEVGQKMQDSQGMLVYYLVGSQIKKSGLERIRYIAGRSKLKPAELVDIIDKLEPFKKNRDGLVNGYKMEYAIMNTMIPIDDAFRLQPDTLGEEISYRIYKFLRIPPFNRFFFNANQTRSYNANSWRNRINNLDRSYSLYDVSEPDDLKEFRNTGAVKLLFTENAVGKILHTIGTPTIEGCRVCTEDFAISATQIVTATRAYYIEHKRYPTSLDELTPKYISKVPQDPYDGKPLRYSADKKIIYSVGEGLKDLGGSPDEKPDKMKNPTIKIEFKEEQ